MKDRIRRAFALVCIPVIALAGSSFAVSSAPESPAKAPAPQCSGELQRISFTDSTGYPRVILDNGHLKVTVYVPNLKTGYYRGARFDWAGMIGRVEYLGHQFYGEWMTPHDASNPEHGIGPAEEYDMDMPPGYAEAKIGGRFLKIGVGVLLRPQEPAKYFFNHRYEIAHAGLWEITATRRCIEFSQSATDSAGHGYEYKKVISIDSATITIMHRLKNTGAQAMSTEQYSHNFTIIDGDSIGPHYRVKFPFQPIMTDNRAKAFAGIAALQGETLSFTGQIPAGKSLWASFGGLRNLPADNGFTIENTRTGASVIAEGSLAPCKYNFYAVKSAVCPEPFVRIVLQPGETAEWKTLLTFRIEKGTAPRGDRTGASGSPRG